MESLNDLKLISSLPWCLPVQRCKCGASSDEIKPGNTSWINGKPELLQWKHIVSGGTQIVSHRKQRSYALHPSTSSQKRRCKSSGRRTNISLRRISDRIQRNDNSTSEPGQDGARDGRAREGKEANSVAELESSLRSSAFGLHLKNNAPRTETLEQRRTKHDANRIFSWPSTFSLSSSPPRSTSPFLP